MEWEEDDWLVDFLFNGGNGFFLLGNIGVSGIVVDIRGGLVGFYVVGRFVVVDFGDGVELVVNEFVGLIRSGLVVEVGMDVGGNNVDDVVDWGYVISFEGREYIGGGVGVSVVGRVEFFFGVDNEVGELLNGVVVVEESFVIDDVKVDKVLFFLFFESRDLLGNGGVVVVVIGVVDEEIND